MKFYTSSDMKYLFIFSIVFFGARVVNAQTDTLRDERNQIPKEAPAVSPSEEKQNSDFVLIPADRIPPALRQVLLNELYAGWENGGVYQNKETREYTVKIKTAGDSIKYWFDEKGQPITALGSAPGSTPN
jgi:hypothetical protein